MTPVSVALVEDDPDLRARLIRAVGNAPSLTLAHSAATASELLTWLEDHLVDVLLVDLGLPDLPGLEVIRRCRRMQPSCAVMVITMFGDEASMLQAFEAGAQGYLLKDGTEDDLARHVRDLNAGGSPMSPIIARQLLSRWHGGETSVQRIATASTATSAAMADMLSRREAEVLDLVARGFMYVEIAARMEVSVTTVRTHVRNIYAKLGVHNKAEALFEARQVGLLR